jgi:hypothetical protein
MCCSEAIFKDATFVNLWSVLSSNMTFLSWFSPHQDQIDTIYKSALSLVCGFIDTVPDATTANMVLIGGARITKKTLFPDRDQFLSLNTASVHVVNAICEVWSMKGSWDPARHRTESKRRISEHWEHNRQPRRPKTLHMPLKTKRPEKTASNHRAEDARFIVCICSNLFIFLLYKSVIWQWKFWQTNKEGQMSRGTSAEVGGRSGGAEELESGKRRTLQGYWTLDLHVWLCLVLDSYSSLYKSRSVAEFSSIRICLTFPLLPFPSKVSLEHYVVFYGKSDSMGWTVP